MKTVCCRFYPACYCEDLPKDPVHEQRMRLLRDATPPGDSLRVEILLRAVARRRRRNVVILTLVFITVVGVALLALTGCRPRDTRPAPEPTTTEMFTVIRPPVGHLTGGIYDNN